MKCFISYCSDDAELAKRLQNDLSRLGVDTWQFEASATVGGDSWEQILNRIQQSDVFIVLLTSAALNSRPVREEIRHAHYCCVNSIKELPRIIPLEIEKTFSIPAQLVRLVRLPFDIEAYAESLASLCRNLGIDDSPFTGKLETDVTCVKQGEFDVKREAQSFAESLLANNKEIKERFEQLTKSDCLEKGGRFRLATPFTILVGTERSKTVYDGVREMNSAHMLLVWFPLPGGISNGYWMREHLIVEIVASEQRKYITGDLEKCDSSLRLQFRGIARLETDRIRVEEWALIEKPELLWSDDV